MAGIRGQIIYNERGEVISATGAMKAKLTILENNGDDFFSVIGSRGGRWKGKKGFATDKKRASKAGKRGGVISRRGKSNA